jgi:acyl-CoA carboxylase subunit beta
VAFDDRSSGDAKPRAARGLTSSELLAGIFDADSWGAWPELQVQARRAALSALPEGPDEDYRRQLSSARAASGVDESVIGGAGRVSGVPCAGLVWEFGFLAGSVGVATAAIAVAAIRRATGAGLPLVAITRSGGTRMQEGALAFVQMAPVTAAIAAHKSQGLPFMVYLADPTTGGVLASLASLGDYAAAQPGGLVGFLGPRVYEALHGEAFPEGVQRAENLLAHGVIDRVADVSEAAADFGTLLAHWNSARRWSHAPRPFQAGVVAPWLGPVGRSGPSGSNSPVAGVRAPGTARVSGEDSDAGASGAARTELASPQGGRLDLVAAGPEDLWSHILATRSPQRSGVREFATALLAGAVVLSGTGAGEASVAMRVMVGAIQTRVPDGRAVPVVLIGTDDRQSGHPLTPAALREAQRGIALASRWGLPIVSVVDTLGGQLSVAAEEGAIAGEIARTTADMAAAPVPTLAVLLGAGTGGVALSLLVADRVIASERAWVSPLPPEGAATIRYRDASRAPQAAWEQGVAAARLAEAGFIDVVTQESQSGDPVMGAAAAVRDLLPALLEGWDPAARLTRFVAWSQ